LQVYKKAYDYILDGNDQNLINKILAPNGRKLQLGHGKEKKL
jgi:hypothetical protein